MSSALAADIARLFEMVIHQSPWIRGSVLRFFAAHGALTLIILGGPALAAGCMFPTLCTLRASSQPMADNPIGRVTAWHYVGAGAGATAGAFLLLPRLGATASLTVLTAVALLSAGFVLRFVRGNGQTRPTPARATQSRRTCRAVNRAQSGRPAGTMHAGADLR